MEKILKDMNIGLVKTGESMADHTTMRIGGPADIFVQPTSIENLQKLISYLRKNKISYLIIGSGANLIVSDKGLRDLVIDTSKFLKKVNLDKDGIIAWAGSTIIETARFAMENSLSGMEGLNGIPGTIGGGIYMNAGAYGTEFSDIVDWVEVINEDCQLEIIQARDLDFKYRSSIVNKRDLTVTRVRLSLSKGKEEEIRALNDEYKSRRVASQPLTYPSAGSTFKRPEGYYAAAMIEEAGLKGMVHRGLRVSDKHSGFVINHNKGNFSDWMSLVNLIKKEVYKKFGVMLELENLIVGDL